MELCVLLSQARHLFLHAVVAYFGLARGLHVELRCPFAVSGWRGRFGPGRSRRRARPCSRSGIRWLIPVTRLGGPCMTWRLRSATPRPPDEVGRVTLRAHGHQGWSVRDGRYLRSSAPELYSFGHLHDVDPGQGFDQNTWGNLRHPLCLKASSFSRGGKSRWPSRDPAVHASAPLGRHGSGRRRSALRCASLFRQGLAAAGPSRRGQERCCARGD